MLGFNFRKIFLLGGLVSTVSCAYLYTCPFWYSRRFIERGERE